MGMNESRECIAYSHAVPMQGAMNPFTRVKDAESLFEILTFCTARLEYPDIAQCTENEAV